MKIPLPSARSSAAVLFVVLGTTAMVASVDKAGAVFNGQTTTINWKSFFAVEVEKGNYGSATIVQTPRCILTAAHVLYSAPNTKRENVRLVQGPDATSSFNLFQGIDKFEAVNPAIIDKIWEDLAVGWVTNYKVPSTTVAPGNRYILEATYEPRSIGKVEDMGFTAIAHNEHTSPEKPKFTPIQGYGYNNGNTGAGELRKGYPRVIAYWKEKADNTDGSAIGIFGLKTNAETPQMACKGDSGAGVMYTGKIRGVVQSDYNFTQPIKAGQAGVAWGGTCTAKNPVNIYTTLNSTGDPAKPGNYEKVVKLIRDLCGVTVSMSNLGGGTVIASLSPAQNPNGPEAFYNSTISCGGTSTDCTEFMHYGQTLFAEAIPLPGHKFVRWENNRQNPSGRCVCAENPTDPTCAIPYDSVGYYDSVESIDSSICFAAFAPLTCGNSTVDYPEQCDTGGQSATCDYECTHAVCGDAVLNTSAGEACDDANPYSGDGCSASCQIETNYCGDGVQQTGEQCDDGIGLGTGRETPYCRANCTLPVCGDGTIDMKAGEECDDDNLTNGDGCSSQCQAERCGNAIKEGSEQCDHGREGSETCTSSCMLSSCGDGTVNAHAEQCDDGGTADGDGCSSICRTETNSCGDGNIDTGEQCDDGPGSASCDADCTHAMCGDDVINAAADEMCDDGNLANGDGCSMMCQLEEYCGDNTVQTGEQCDDGNGLDGDGCSVLCKFEYCGDGERQPTEQCDDGNLLNGDGCSMMCTIESVSSSSFSFSSMFSSMRSSSSYSSTASSLASFSSFSMGYGSFFP